MPITEDDVRTPGMHARNGNDLVVSQMRGIEQTGCRIRSGMVVVSCARARAVSPETQSFRIIPVGDRRERHGMAFDFRRGLVLSFSWFENHPERRPSQVFCDTPQILSSTDLPDPGNEFSEERGIRCSIGHHRRVDSDPVRKDTAIGPRTDVEMMIGWIIQQDILFTRRIARAQQGLNRYRFACPIAPIHAFFEMLEIPGMEQGGVLEIRKQGKMLRGRKQTARVGVSRWSRAYA